MGKGSSLVATCLIMSTLGQAIAGTEVAVNSYEGLGATFHVADSTGLPIHGAMALISYGVTSSDGSIRSYLHVEEVTSDWAGRMEVPPWGPRSVEPGELILANQPLVFIFKPGFVPLFFNNGSSMLAAPKAIHIVSVTGKVVQLASASADRDSYLDQLRALFMGVRTVIRRSRCSGIEIDDAAYQELKLLGDDIYSPPPANKSCEM